MTMMMMMMMLILSGIYIYIVDIYIHTVSTLDKATYLIEKAVRQQGSVVLLEVVSAQTKQAGL